MISAAMNGVMRQVQNLKGDRTDVYGAALEDGWKIAIAGTLGEMAFAKWSGIYNCGVGTFRGPDVGRYEVRTSHNRNARLILHPDDKDDAIYWLLNGFNGHYRVRGWTFGRDGKNSEYWEDPTGTDRFAFFVPHDKLHPPTERPPYA